MQRKWQQWNRKAHTILWALVVIGIIAALPLGATRWQMEKTSKQVEYIFNYRALVQIASYKAKPQSYIQEQLVLMKEAGITTMAVFESSLQELRWAGRLSLYNSDQAGALEGKPSESDENFTYVLFNGPQEAEAYRDVITSTFNSWDIPVRPWKYGDREGLVLETPLEDAILKQMNPDPLAVKTLHDKGFQLLPRLSDRTPFDAAAMEKLFADYKELGVKRILFDGAAVKGFNDNAEMKSLYTFADILNKNGIGITAIENSKPQKGMSTLAYLTHYNVNRLYSLSDTDAFSMTSDAIADRFQLAAKDRSVRMFYLNGSPVSSADKSSITDPLDNIYTAIAGNKEEKGAIKKLSDLGFEPGVAHAFKYEQPSWQKPLKAVVALGAIAFIALLLSAFIPGAAVPAFVLGLLGSAALYVLSKSALEQGLALGASISAPTLAVIWAIRRVRAHTVGNRRPVGGAADFAASQGQEQWIFPGIGAGRRITMAIALFATTSVISFAGIPFIIGLLNNITYSLVIEQFRGVSMLHLAPIALIAIYVFLYTGESVFGNLRRLLMMKITILGVIVAVVVGAAGMYYLSRTGNEGQTTAFERLLRNTLETVFGVRPRNKEFLFAHPLFFFGLFLALRYRAAWVLFIVGVVGQLSMVDTFAHIHTPIYISIIRVLLGLVLGAIIGFVMIAVWQVLEGVWKRWGTRLAQGKMKSKSGA